MSRANGLVPVRRRKPPFAGHHTLNANLELAARATSRKTPAFQYRRCGFLNILPVFGGLGNDVCVRLNRAGSARGITLVANSNNRLRLISDSDAHLRSVIANLEESRAALVESTNLESAQILAMALLQLRMRLHRVADSELKVLCQAVQLQEADRAKKAEELAAKERSATKRNSRWPKSIK
jgi:hypothetical protein